MNIGSKNKFILTVALRALIDWERVNPIEEIITTASSLGTKSVLLPDNCKGSVKSENRQAHKMEGGKNRSIDFHRKMLLLEANEI